MISEKACIQEGCSENPIRGDSLGYKNPWQFGFDLGESLTAGVFSLIAGDGPMVWQEKL
ncbi:hypothetical protein [Thermotalea metallivorans]|nr:hypothetical protein [Thermotalea metallivorans]